MAYSIRTASSGYLTGSNYSYGGSSGSGSLRKVPLRQQAEVQTQPCPVSTSESPAVSYHKQNTYSYRDSTQGIYDNIRRKKEKEEEDWSRRRRNKEEQNHSQSNPFQDLPISLAIRETMSTMVTNHCAALQKHAVAEKQLDLTDTPERKAPTKEEMFNEHRKKIEGIEEAIHSMEQLRMDLADSLMPGALHKFDELKETLEDVTDIFEKSFEQAARNWPYSDELRLAQNNYLEKAGCLTEVTKKLKKKEKKLAFQEAKMINQGWIAKAKDFFIPVGPKVDRLKNEIMKLKKEAEEYQATGLEKLKFRLLNDDIWNEPAEEDSISNEANAISRIKKEVKEYFQKDVEAMQEATAGGWVYSGQPSSGGPTSSTVPFVTSPSVPTETAGSGRAVAESAQGERCPKQEVNGRANAEVDDESQPEATGPPSKRQKVEATAVNLRRSTRVNSAKASADPSPPSCPVRPTPSGSGGGRAPLVNSPDAHQHELTKVKPTDVIAEEMPFAQAVNSRFLKKVCSNCLVMKSDDTESLKLTECVDCKKVCYCSKECRLVDAKFHQDECRYIRMSKYCPNEETRIVSRMITRVRNGDTPDAFNGRTFKDLMTHAEVISGEKAKLYKYKETFKSIRKFMGDNSPSEAEFLECFGKMLVNSFYTLSQSSDLYYATGTALYQGISIHNHSCRPNCAAVFDGNKINLKSLVPGTAYNTDLTFNYTDILKPKEYRKHDLFDCECPRCKDPKEELLERSGKCDACPDGYILPSGEEPLHCERCGEESSLTIDSINRANEALRLCWEYDNVKELREDLGTSAEAELRAKKEEVSSSLSKYNLFAYRANGLLQPKTLDESERSARETYEEWSYYYARRKETIEHYARDTGFHKAILMVIANHEKEIFEEVDNSREQAAKAADAYKAAYDASKSYYGPDHRLTKELKDKEDEMRKNV